MLKVTKTAAGRHEVTWNGRDDKGLPAAAGVSLCRLSAEDRKEAKTMVLINRSYINLESGEA